jgi:hypothetical protein
MQEVKVNRIKLICSKGRVERDEIVILPENEVNDIERLRPGTVTFLRTVEEKKPARKKKNAKRTTLD